MTGRISLLLRCAAALIFLLSGAWSVAYLMTLPVNWTIAGMCVLSAALWLLLAWLLLRNHPGRLTTSTPGFIVASFAAGMTLLSPAVTTNTSAIALKDWLGMNNLQFGLLSPITEEVLKYATVFVLCTMVYRIRRPIEAVAVGIAVGFGFSAIENVTYVIRGALDNLDSDVVGALLGFGVRILAGPWGHSIYTGLAAWGLGVFLCRTDKPIGWRVSRLIGWSLLGYGLHAFFNSASELPGEIAHMLGFFAAILFAWAGGVWLYLRSRKNGRRDFTRATAAPHDVAPAQPAISQP